MRFRLITHFLIPLTLVLLVFGQDAESQEKTPSHRERNTTFIGPKPGTTINKTKPAINPVGTTPLNRTTIPTPGTTVRPGLNPAGTTPPGRTTIPTPGFTVFTTAVVIVPNETKTTAPTTTTKTTTRATTTTEAAPTPTPTTDRLRPPLPSPFTESGRHQLPSATFLGEPGSLKFVLILSTIIFFAILLILMIATCVFGTKTKEVRHFRRITPEPSSISILPRTKPSSKSKPHRHHHQRHPRRSKPPVKQEETETEDSLVAPTHVPVHKAPGGPTRITQKQLPMPLSGEQQYGYQLVPLPIKPGDKGQQFTIGGGQGQEPMVIYLPMDFSTSGGTPVLIPLPANTPRGVGKTGGTASESEAQTTEAETTDGYTTDEK